MGDIGSYVSRVEDNLQFFLQRGQDWNAVVLLDEAVCMSLLTTPEKPLRCDCLGRLPRHTRRLQPRPEQCNFW